MKDRLICAIAILSLAVCLDAKANLVTNPGFEDGATGWTFTGSAGVHTNDGLDPAHSGNGEALVNTFAPTVGSISQTIATTPGGLYLVSFWLASNSPVGNPSGLVQLSFDGTTGYSERNPVVSLNNYVQEFFYASASGSSSVLALNINLLGSDSGTYFVDDFSVTPAQVPIPAALLLFNSGLAATLLGSVWRRGKRRS